MSLYTKYRSKTFGEIYTQDHVVNTLKSFISSGEDFIPQGYVFFGTRGSGKTSLARIIARVLNCDDREYVNKNLEPCNVCKSCKLALSNSHPDIIEMDAASNRGIDDIRAIKETAIYYPTVGRKKVYIIDEAHMMTKEAFNSLLKILEEPPKHVVFILCTTEIYKIPSTILSRIHIFELKNASIPDLISKIKMILNKELLSKDIVVTEEAVREVALLGNGSFRDAETFLEKLIKWVNVESNHKLLNKYGEVGVNDIYHVFGLSSLEKVSRLFSAIKLDDISLFNSLFEEYISQDNVSSFIDQLIKYSYGEIKAILETESNNKLLEVKRTNRLLGLFLQIQKKIYMSNDSRVTFYSEVLRFLLRSKRVEGGDKKVKGGLENLEGNSRGEVIKAKVKEVGVFGELSEEKEKGSLDKGTSTKDVLENQAFKKVAENTKKTSSKLSNKIVLEKIVGGDDKKMIEKKSAKDVNEKNNDIKGKNGTKDTMARIMEILKESDF